MTTSETHCSGFSCPITGFNFFWNKLFVMGSVAMIVWTNLFSWFWHGNIMAASYQSTATLWRGPQEMVIPALNGGISLMAVIATYIFMKGYEATGWKEGLRFGILITALLLGLGLVTYATQPIPREIIQMWALGDLIQYSVGGILLSFIFKK